MNILFLCKKPPYPAMDGESIAISQLIEGFLKLGHSVHVLYMETPKHKADLSKFPEVAGERFKHHGIFQDTTIRVMDVLSNLIWGSSYHLDRFLSETLPEKLAEWLKVNDYNIVQLEGLYLAPYVSVIRKHSKALVAMRSHNVESQIWQRLTEQLPLGPKKIYLQIQTARLRKFELEKQNTYDAMIPITREDADFFKNNGCQLPMHVCPAGFDLNKWKITNGNHFERSVYHLGALDWLPNLEGIEWFLKAVWPEVVKKHPDANFYLAGRNFPKTIKGANQKGVHLIGEVDDAVEFVKNKTLMITPLFSGSGMRIKIVEGMAAGMAIVSTKVGAEGINYTNGENILLAETAGEFVSQIDKCFSNPELSLDIGKKAKEFAVNHYDSHKFASELMAFYSRQL